MTTKESNHPQPAKDKGFTLVEVLIAIVIVGILSAVVVVGIASLTNKGSSSACTASLDAAKAAATVHYANSATYPATLAAMTTTNPPELVLPTGVTVVTPFMKTTGASWTLTMTVAGTATTPPTLVCTVP